MLRPPLHSATFCNIISRYMSAVLRGEVVSESKEEELLDRSMELFRHLQVAQPL